MPDRLRERLQSRLEALGINPFEAARRAGVERSYINDLLIGKKSSMRPRQLGLVAEALECDPDFLTGLQSVPRAGQVPFEGVGMPLSGIVEPNVWRGEDAEEVGKTIPLQSDPRFPVDRQKWFLVRGDAALSMGISDGSVVITVEGFAVRDGEPVVIRRRRGDAVETSVRVKVGEGYLPPPGQSGAPIPAGEAELVGLVVLTFRIFGG